MDVLHEHTIALCQKAARYGDRQFLGAIIMREGVFDIYIIAEAQTHGLKLKKATLIPASEFHASDK